MVYVNFWFEKKCIYSWFPENIPHFHKGDTIYIEINSTPLGRTKYPHAPKIPMTEFIIDKVTHSLKQEYADDIDDYYSFEINLKKPFNQALKRNGDKAPPSA